MDSNLTSIGFQIVIGERLEEVWAWGWVGGLGICILASIPGDSVAHFGKSLRE